MLTIDGDVHRPMQLSYKALERMPQRTVTATLECAGNGRVGFGGVKEGEVAWGHGAVATATWTGVPVVQLLESSAPSSGATHLVVEGEDEGPIGGSSEKIRFERALPMAKALDPDCIVALSMNSKALSRSHGFPARMIVPGWYGMASVKWLRRIQVVSGGTFKGHFYHKKYTYVAGREVVPVTHIRVKSLILSPRHDQVLERSKPLSIRGKAWSGTGAIKRIEVFINGRRRDAEIRQPLGFHAWANWSVEWTPKKSGRNTISARATDASGNSQPARPFQNLNQYGYNAVQTIQVSVM